MRGLSGSRRKMIGVAGVSVIVLAIIASAVFVKVIAAPQPSNPLQALPLSTLSVPRGAVRVGDHPTSATMTIEVSFKMSAQALSDLNAISSPTSPQYRHFLPQGAFDQRYAPAASVRDSVSSYMASHGLKVAPVYEGKGRVNPFLLRATGTTAAVEAAFHTSLADYRMPNGRAFFQNTSAVRLPASLASNVAGVVGLTNLHHLNPDYVTTRSAAQRAGRPAFTYGGGPGGSGLTPSQITSIYGAQAIYHVGASGKGAGVTMAVFELSGYTRQDITAYETQFGLPHAGITDSTVDGGPLNPQLPPGDTVLAAPDYSGDIEVEADVETQLAVAPDASNVIVYNAPNDFLGLGPVDEYYQIAADDSATSISTSWGACEQDATFGMAVAEFGAFLQMALQGQTIFAAAGDTGAFDCLRGSGNLAFAVDDPASQPFVTAVGGTSFGTFDPVSNPTPSYPTGHETVWNPLSQCDASNPTNCNFFGAGGGGNSAFWGWSDGKYTNYQSGQGVISSYTQYGGPGGTGYCQQQDLASQPCREVPDVSANADEFTPYAEYCTGNPLTNSTCASFSSTLTPPGWFGIGGTSLAAPLWAGIIGLWSSYHAGNSKHFGWAVRSLYGLFHHVNTYGIYFHDITGVNQAPNNNGYFPATPGYDMATGIGSPNISNIATSNPYALRALTYSR